MSIRDDVLMRSGGNCEAMVKLPRAWVRCGKTPVEDHHLLTRARGGSLLDDEGGIYHHLALCHEHHRTAHSSGGRENGLIMDGHVVRNNATGKLVYSGPDEVLANRYPDALR